MCNDSLHVGGKSSEVYMVILFGTKWDVLQKEIRLNSILKFLFFIYFFTDLVLNLRQSGMNRQLVVTMSTAFSFVSIMADKIKNKTLLLLFKLFTSFMSNNPRARFLNLCILTTFHMYEGIYHHENYHVVFFFSLFPRKGIVIDWNLWTGSIL